MDFISVVITTAVTHTPSLVTRLTSSCNDDRLDRKTRCIFVEHVTKVTHLSWNLRMGSPLGGRDATSRLDFFCRNVASTKVPALHLKGLLYWEGNCPRKNTGG